MGRPLKIQKYSPGSADGNQPVPVDSGFNAFDTLTDPEIPAGSSLTSSEFVGVVGGIPNTGTSTTYPVIEVSAYIAGSSGPQAGYIIRQKGSHKFLVGVTANTAPANVVVGSSYMITSVGSTTDWTSIGGPTNPAVGSIFTASAVGAGDGVTQEVGVCVLDSSATPGAGNVSITFQTGGSNTAVVLSKISNKFLLDWAGGNSYAQSDVVNDNRYGTNFFSNAGTEAKSGAENAGTIPLALVENYTAP